ncbi:hypothetical protein QO008_000095 [Peptoniphilus ivorii]|uniref:NusG domain II-containing protein n=1 Tax=Aedoeadaptatus ivorii TaxID=54006 RepID=UPI00278B2125|nr:NusG domain II-containing protein [Peptoniphilus ivorii]MDQ0507658.1 hypothetical protein [Peptoniphilus ivorii]
MNRTDRIIALLVLVVALGLAATQLLPNRAPKGDVYISIQIDGKEMDRIPFRRENFNKRFVYHGIEGTNVITLDEKGAKMIEADCPDQICLRMAPIKEPGEMIVCLPHRVIAEVKSEEVQDMDILLR